MWGSILSGRSMRRSRSWKGRVRGDVAPMRRAAVYWAEGLEGRGLVSPASAGVGGGEGDGGGRLGLILENNGGGKVSVLLGKGNGTFGAQQTLGAGSQARFVVAADLNGDGKPDLAVANYGAGTVSVLLGNGNGTFAGQTTF